VKKKEGRHPIKAGLLEKVLVYGARTFFYEFSFLSPSLLLGSVFFGTFLFLLNNEKIAPH